MAKVKMPDEERAERKKLVRQWRVRKGKAINKDGRPLSYQQIVEMTNAKIGEPILKYPTVASWGTRGNTPVGASATALKAVEEFKDFPLLNSI